jgi:hypothetical protein
MKKDFQKLTSTFKNSIKTWDYFVNWKKVFKNSSELEISLNKLNYLLGKENLRDEFNRLYRSNPDIVRTIPILVAVRESNIEVFDKLTKDSQIFDFTNNTDLPETYFEFIERSGIARLFARDGVKNLVDYVLGVEVGLDSNGRKNRTGKLMENIVEVFISDFSNKYGYEYLKQAKAKTIKKKWNIDIKVDKSSRSFDFALYNPISKKIKLFETNFYNGGGSKLKAVCGEFKSLFSELKSQDIDFIWVTDGLGWNTALRPLEETFNHNEYVFNLAMLEADVLRELNW